MAHLNTVKRAKYPHDATHVDRETCIFYKESKNGSDVMQRLMGRWVLCLDVTDQDLYNDPETFISIDVYLHEMR